MIILMKMHSAEAVLKINVHETFGVEIYKQDHKIITIHQNLGALEKEFEVLEVKFVHTRE